MVLGEPNINLQYGRISIVSSETGKVLWEYFGDQPNSAGRNLVVLPDFDGDGVFDIATGNSTFPSDGSLLGSVRVISGATQQVIVEIVGSQVGDRLGRAVAFAGDVNGDGLSDIIAGAFYDAYVHLGPDGELFRFHDGPFTRPSASALGDIDGDGADDYLMGWPQDETLGCAGGRVTLHSGATGATLHENFGVGSCSSSPAVHRSCKSTLVSLFPG